MTHLERPLGERITCDEWADRWLAKVEREQKASSLGTARDSLTAFRDNFGARPIGSITHIDAEDWANSVPVGRVKTAVSLFNYAVRQRVVDYNPFAGLGKRGRGRQDTDPPTVKARAAAGRLRRPRRLRTTDAGARHLRQPHRHEAGRAL